MIYSDVNKKLPIHLSKESYGFSRELLNFISPDT